MIDERHFEGVLAGAVDMVSPFDRPAGVVVGGAIHRQEGAMTAYPDGPRQSCLT